MPRKKSIVWDYFSKVGKDKVKCSNCGDILAFKGPTSTLMYHIEKKHKIPVQHEDDVEENSIAEADNTQPKISHVLRKPNFSKGIAELACVDGIPFRTIACSKFIQKALPLLGYKNVKSHSTVKKHFCIFEVFLKNYLLKEVKRD